jgi:ferrous iron transport protein B
MHPVIALAGNPNVGKTTLFNALSGQNLRTANYPGVTVARHAGLWSLPQGEAQVVDLPGSYSLAPHSPDEALVTQFLKGEAGPRPDAILAIIDASNPERNFYFLSQLMDLGLPVVVALNMVDVAKAKGLAVDAAALQASLGVPVLPIQASQRLGLEALAQAMQAALSAPRPAQGPGLPVDGPAAAEPDVIRKRYAWSRQHLLDALTRSPAGPQRLGDRVDRVLTHKVWGSLALLLVMGMVFQSIYAWSQPLMEGMEGLVSWLGGQLLSPLPPGLLKDLLADGVVAGVGGVVVFVPQIAVLFLFIALLEDCGYMARSAFLMDRLFAKIGLSGRSFIPLLSSFACAVPGILATRTIADRKERLTAMLVAPLMSCSARLPVYTIMIAAFVPATRYYGIVDLRALTLLGFYGLGLAVALPVAWLLRKRLQGGAAPLFLIELPGYKWPDPRTVARRVWEQAGEFVAQAGSIILAVTVIVWALGAFPRSPALAADFGAQRTAVEGSRLAPEAQAQRLRQLERDEKAAVLQQSWLGRMGQAVEPVFAPLGWDWRISMAAIASFPAREVVIGVLGTIFSSEEADDAESAHLRQTLQSVQREDGSPLFNLAVALSLMVFFALCAQCAATLAVIARESGHWGWAAFTFAYMTALAWLGAAATYQLASWLGWAA